MSEVLEILSELKRNEVSLSLDETGLNLKLRGNVSSLSNEAKGVLKLNKERLIEFLKENSASSIISIPTSHNSSGIFSLSPNQKGIWFHEKLEDLGTTYIIPAIYFYELEDFNERIFDQALDFLVQENDVFRLLFDEKNGEPYQELKETIDVRKHFEIVKVSDKMVLQEQISIKSQVLFSPESSPVWDITVYQLPESSYCFYLRFHHLIGDGESLNLFIGNLIEVYIQLQKGIGFEKKNHLQYCDYVSWITQKENFARSSVFWKKEFENYEENFQLNHGALKNSADTDSGRTYRFNFSTERTASLRTWAVSNRVSLASLYTAATGVVLSKRGNSSDFVIGIPTASRNHPQLTGVIGNLVNTVPLRITIDYSIDQKTYIQSIQNRYLAVLEHQIYPFEYILEDIDYQRRSNEYPLFNVMISVPNYSNEVRSLKSEIELESKTSLYDLTFTFIESAKNIELALEYDTSKFDIETIKKISNEIDFVFEQLLGNNSQPLSQISLISQSVKEDESISSHLVPTATSVLDFLNEQVEKNSGNKAIVFGERTLSYQEFNDSILSLANYLKEEKGLVPNSCVVVSLGKSIEQLVSMYAIWMLGGIYIPIDSSLPGERKRLILEDCEAEIIIDSTFIETYQNSDKKSINSIDSSNIKGDSIAYLLYTSGTTGKPKGVMISHANLVNKIQEETQLVSISENTITYTLTNSSFDVSFLETVLPLSNGGLVIISDELELQDTEKTILSIVKNKVTHLQGTPTYFSHFTSLLTDETSEKLNEKLQYISIGGESLNAYLVHQIKSKLPTVQINNHYGPTEITIDALVKEDVSTFIVNSIGLPIGNTTAYVVDEFGNLLPKGVVGELVIGGPSVFMGYWKDEQLTESKLRTLPFTEGIFYKTGDLTKINSEDEFEFVGRKDKQVKLRGYRIELDDINQTLLNLHGVQQAISQIIDNVLVSWVVSDIEEGLLREQLRSLLPAYMIPQSIVIVESFPMTDNGKVAVNKLPKSFEFHREYVAPRSEKEFQIVEIWKEVLGLEKVGIYDNFFELGGHSLKITQLVSRYQKVFGVQLTIKDLFFNITPASHFELITITAKKVEKTIIPLTVSEDYPVSYAQQRMWLLSQMEGGSVAYNMPVTLRLKGKLDVEKFISSIESVIDKHEILRTVFRINKTDEIRQKIKTREETGFKIELIDLQASASKEEQIQATIEQGLNIPFDFENGTLVRISLFVINESEYIFHYNMHHIISDGWSMEVLAKEVLTAYYGSNPNDVGNEKLRIQYKEYAVWQREQVERNEKEHIYWTTKFEGEIPVLEIPSQNQRPNLKKYHGNNSTFELNQVTTQRLKKYCQQQEGTLFMGLLAGLKGILYRYTQQKDIVIGTPIAGRTQFELENQIGMYVNTLAMRTEFEVTDSFDQLFSKVKDTTLGAYEHQNYPFDKLVDDLKLTRDLSRNPLFDVMLVLQNMEQTEISSFTQSEELTISHVNTTHTTSQFDLTFTFSEVDDKLIGFLEYDSGIYTEIFVQQLSNHFVRFMDQAIVQQGKSIAEISYLEESERNRIIQDFNKTETNFKAVKSVIDLFEEQVSNNPDNTALVFENKEITYLELNIEINQFSHYLQDEYKIKEGDLIGVKLGRSEKMIVAILAILKSGAAYVPIDIHYPEKRIQYIEKDIAGKLVITESVFEQFELEKSEYSTKNDLSAKNLNRLAYIIYTSGTTGDPKGVMVEQKQLAAYVNTFVNYFNVSSSDSIISVSTIAFDTSIEEIFPILTVGGKLIIAKDNKNLEAVFTDCQIHHVSILSTNPYIIKELNENVENYHFSFQKIISGGDVIKFENVSKLIDKVEVYNTYGPTETTVCASYFKINTTSDVISIGKPIANTQIFILDEYQQVVPIGVKGSIYISGDGLTRGYLNNEELTQSKFIDHPFITGAKMYDSGDIGYWQEDGNILFIGREDEQVKIRGYRIELNEIENAIQQFNEKLTDVIIIPRLNHQEKIIVAYFVSDELVDKSALRAFLLTRIPDYMLPSCYVQIAQIPISENGKIDRKALPEITENDFIRGEYEAPGNEIERTLVKIWEEVLGLNGIGVTDNFFELGGHSLKAMKVLQRVKTIFGIKLSVEKVFKTVTIKELGFELDFVLQQEKLKVDSKELISIEL